MACKVDVECHIMLKSMSFYDMTFHFLWWHVYSCHDPMSCHGVGIWKYENMKIWKYENMKIWKYEIWNMKYENMKVWKYENDLFLDHMKTRVAN